MEEKEKKVERGGWWVSPEGLWSPALMELFCRTFWIRPLEEPLLPDLNPFET